MNRRVFIIVCSLFILLVPLVTTVYAALSFGSGVYTNLCGTGTAATADSCNRGCNPGSGSCSSSVQGVVKYTCEGRQTECRSGESSFSTSQSVGGSCGKTVQIDVFNKTCRVNGGWVCSAADLQDYMVWYSGDCPKPTVKPTKTPTPKPKNTPRPTNTPTPTPVPEAAHVSSCDGLTITSGNDSIVPATITFQASGSDNKGSISRYRFFFGDGQSLESAGRDVQHRYEVSGKFTARVEVKDSRGNWKTSDSCQTTATVKPLAVVESHKSDCSNVYITNGNQTQAPTTATFTVAGYDNKGAIQKYKIDYGNGQTEEKDLPTFERRYENPGTYVIRGFVKDSQGNWKGNEEGCRQSLYINTKPMVAQPKTGTPTMFTLVSVASGLASVGFFAGRKILLAKS